MQLSESEESSEDELDPKVAARIEQISEILSQTNKNLNMFERFLPATVSGQQLRPIEQMTTVFDSKTSQIEADLRQQITELQSQLTEAELRATKAETECQNLTSKNIDLRSTIIDLKEEISILRKSESIVPRVNKLSNISDDNIELDKKNAIMQPNQKESADLCAKNVAENKDRVAELEGELVCLKDSRDRLKIKTRELLRKYRSKRSLLEKRERMLTSQKSGLRRLEVLHKSLQSSHAVVVDYLSQELTAVARLTSLLLDEVGQSLEPDIPCYSPANHATWFTRLQTLLNTTKQVLVRAIIRERTPLEDPGKVEHLYRKLVMDPLLPAAQDTDNDQETAVQLRSGAETVSLCESLNSTLQTLLAQ